MDLLNIQLQAPPSQLTKDEERVIAELFTSPTARKYLEIMQWTIITDHANIPLPLLATERDATILKQAFVKGSLSIIQTLLSIQKSQQPRN